MTMRPARPSERVRFRRQCGAVWLMLVMLAPPAAAQDAPAPLVWTRVESAPADGGPLDARPAPVAPVAPVTPAPRPAARGTRYDALIDTVARQFDLDAGLLHAMIETESRYDAAARSPKGAVGLMQVMPATGRRFGFVDLDDPATNLRAGATYLKWLLKTFDNRLDLAIAGYNAGEGAVMQSGWQIPPYRETQQYVSAVLDRYRSQDGRAAPQPDVGHASLHRPAPARRTPPAPIALLGRLAGLLLSSPHANTPTPR
jgi:soluble lytic murein transglycosylase-like protein